MAKRAGRTHAQYFADRTKFFESLSATEQRVFDELATFVQKTEENLQAKQDSSSAEANLFERQFAVYFGVALTIVLSGLLTNLPDKASTMAAKVFFSLAILSGLLAIVILFLDFLSTKKFFTQWSKKAQELTGYIRDGSAWGDPQEAGQHIDEEFNKLNTQSSHWYVIVGLTLVGVTYLFVGLWLYETLFNPNWPIF